MDIFSKIKPAFLNSFGDHESSGRPYLPFVKIWQRTTVVILGVALLPLLAMAYFDYQISRQHHETEIALRTDRLVSITKRSVGFFLEERKQALQFIAEDNTFFDLNNDRRMASILQGLGKTMGGFVDLGLFDDKGTQVRYVGPFDLKGIEYGEELWFKSVVTSGSYISDIYLGFRDEPHMVIAVKKETSDGSFFVLRTTLNTASFNQQLLHAQEGGFGESFLINHAGVLQTPTLNYGKVLENVFFEEMLYSEKTQISLVEDFQGRSIIIGYSIIPDTPFIVIVIGDQEKLMSAWKKTRHNINIFLVFSILLIIFITYSVATTLVNRLYRADKARLQVIQEAAQANKLASVGRLAAGVAHEINNPLAIINEKAGLLKDIFMQQSTSEIPTAKLIIVVNSISRAVDRCASITHRLLDFSRPGENKVQEISVEEVIREVLEFFIKDAEHRDISLKVSVDSDLPNLISDRNKLQQIILNLVNNALAALTDGGNLTIAATRREQEVLIAVHDDGHGISKSDLKRIFDPFFSTKTSQGGTGLGLSITYCLVNELKGTIRVESAVGAGTSFFITLPIRVLS